MKCTKKISWCEIGTTLRHEKIRERENSFGILAASFFHKSFTKFHSNQLNLLLRIFALSFYFFVSFLFFLLFSSRTTMWIICKLNCHIFRYTRCTGRRVRRPMCMHASHDDVVAREYAILQVSKIATSVSSAKGIERKNERERARTDDRRPLRETSWIVTLEASSLDVWATPSTGTNISRGSVVGKGLSTK